MATAALRTTDKSLTQLKRKPASDVKREGWRGIMKTVAATGKVLVTNHDEPEAVILSVREYLALSELADRSQSQKQSRLEQLARAFDEDLAVLARPGAGDRLRAGFDAPLKLRGKVIAGRGH